MPRLLVLQHVPGEGPWRLGDLAPDFGLDPEILRLDQGAAVPGALPDGEALLVLGGPMGVGDLASGRWPFLAAEAALLRRCLAEDRPVLGICLGAQLLAHAAGAAVRPLCSGDPPQLHREVGWGAVQFTAPDPALEGLGASAVVLHWHGDTFDLPPGAVRLASTLACREQMFRLGRAAYGVQFHCEATPATAERWAEEDGDFVRLALGPGGAARIVADSRGWAAGSQAERDRFTRNLLAVLARACALA